MDARGVSQRLRAQAAADAHWIHSQEVAVPVDQRQYDCVGQEHAAQEQHAIQDEALATHRPTIRACVRANAW